MALELGAACQECDALIAEASQTNCIGWCWTIKAYKLATVNYNLKPGRYKAQKSASSEMTFELARLLAAKFEAAAIPAGPSRVTQA